MIWAKVCTINTSLAYTYNCLSFSLSKHDTTNTLLYGQSNYSPFCLSYTICVCQLHSLGLNFWVLNRSLCVCLPFSFWIKSCLDASPRIGEEGVAPFDLCNRRLQVVFLPLLEFNVPLQTIPSEEVSLIQYIDKTSPLGSFAVSTHRSMLSHVWSFCLCFHSAELSMMLYTFMHNTSICVRRCSFWQFW